MVINFFFLLSQVIGILGRIAFFLKLGFSFYLMAYILREWIKKIHEVGVFFKSISFLFVQIHILPLGSQVGKVGGW